MKLSKSEYKGLTSSLEEFGQNSQTISSKFINLAKLFINETKKSAASRDKMMLVLTDHSNDISIEINDLVAKMTSGDITQDEAEKKIENLKSRQNKLTKILEEVIDEQKDDSINMVEFHNALDALGLYTESFKNDYLSSVRLIKNAEIDLDGK